MTDAWSFIIILLYITIQYQEAINISTLGMWFTIYSTEYRVYYSNSDLSVICEINKTLHAFFLLEYALSVYLQICIKGKK